MAPSADLPGARTALWRSLRLGLRAEPRLVTFSLGMAVLEAVPDALFALWLKLLAEGIVEHRRAPVIAAAIGLAASSAATWLLRTVAGRLQRRFRMKVAVALESHVARLQASIASIEHQERPDYLDRLAVLRDEVWRLDHMFLGLFSTLGAVLRLIITLGLLMSIHPALVLLIVFAVPAVAVSPWRAGVQRATEERAAPDRRLARHLFELGTSAASGKEVRVSGTAERLVHQHVAAWEGWYGPVSRARWHSALWLSAASAIFGLGYVGAVVFVASGLDAPVGDVLLAVAAGSRLSQYIGMTVGEANFLRMWLDSSKRMAWLEDYADSHHDDADQPVPERLVEGIRLDHVSFRYPGTERLVLDDVSLELPAGAVVALVGENGAGKTTLVKLLCRLYLPSEGTITVDGVDLARLHAEEWRDRVAGAFQDFFRFELRAQQTVGVGDLDRIDEAVAVGAAVTRAGADDVVARLPQHLDTQLGATWEDGVELSFGQWQKLALARGLLREHPLLLVLDEPTAALDAETEHSLFERFAAQSRAANTDGRVTVLVSHRFSTVRRAGLIVVIDGARVTEVGTHAELLARGGTYSELYTIQADSYR